MIDTVYTSQPAVRHPAAAAHRGAAGDHAQPGAARALILACAYEVLLNCGVRLVGVAVLFVAFAIPVGPMLLLVPFGIASLLLLGLTLGLIDARPRLPHQPVLVCCPQQPQVSILKRKSGPSGLLRTMEARKTTNEGSSLPLSEGRK